MEQPVRAVIVANGELSSPDEVLASLLPGDFIIAADGGGRLCRQLGIHPQVLIGDFDSLEPADLASFQSAGSKILHHPSRKDDTDLELAVRYARDLGCRQVLILAGLGARWDQSLANVLLPASADLAEMQIRLVDGPQEMMLVHSLQEFPIQGQTGDTVSLLPLAGDAYGVRTNGLEYALHGETLHFGATRGISNVLLHQTASIFIEKGLVLCVVIHGQHLPVPHPFEKFPR